MTAPDLPPGEWSEIIVGLQWVSGATVTILSHAIANRQTIVTQFSELHDTLQKAIETGLAQQEGMTADAIRDAFQQGVDQAFQVAEKNEAYRKALQQAHNDVVVLRYFLTDIAERGNKEINDIKNSKSDMATKVAKITEAIAKYQREANQKAAACADDIMDAGEGVVTAQGANQSFRGLAHATGLGGNQQPDPKAIEGQVRDKLNQPAALPPAAASGGPGAGPRGGGAEVPPAGSPAAPAGVPAARRMVQGPEEVPQGCQTQRQQR